MEVNLAVILRNVIKTAIAPAVLIRAAQSREHVFKKAI